MPNFIMDTRELKAEEKRKKIVKIKKKKEKDNEKKEIMKSDENDEEKKEVGDAEKEVGVIEPAGGERQAGEDEDEDEEEEEEVEVEVEVEETEADEEERAIRENSERIAKELADAALEVTCSD
jgi:hypothetical protein